MKWYESLTPKKLVTLIAITRINSLFDEELGTYLNQVIFLEVCAAI